MHGNADQTMPDVRYEDLAALVPESRAGMATALDRIVLLGSSSNMFNNCISAAPDSSID